MGKYGAGAGVDELNFTQNRLGLGAGFDPDQYKHAAPGQMGVSTPDDEAALRNQLLQQYGQTQNQPAAGSANLDEAIKRLFGVQTTAAGQPNLANLDPAAQSALAAITQANQSKFDLGRQNAQNQLLQGLFGSGTAQSTIALDQAGRLNYGQDALQAQLLGDAAQRELGLRNDVSNRALQSLGLQTGALTNAGNLATNQGQLGQQQNQLNAQFLDSLLKQGLQRDVANAGFTENAINRAYNQDQFRSQLLAGLGQQTAQMQSQRVNPWSKALNAGLSLASFAIPGGGTLGGSLLGKIPGLGSILAGGSKKEIAPG